MNFQNQLQSANTMTTKIYLTIILVICLASKLASQLYQDAVAIESIIEEPVNLELDLSRVANPEKISIKLDGKSYSDPVLFKTGEYEVSGLAPDDVLGLVYGDSTRLILGTEKVNIDNTIHSITYHYSNKGIVEDTISTKGGIRNHFFWSQKDGLTIESSKGNLNGIEINFPEDYRPNEPLEYNEDKIIWKGSIYPWFIASAVQTTALSIIHSNNGQNSQVVEVTLEPSDLLLVLSDPIVGHIHVMQLYAPYGEERRRKLMNLIKVLPSIKKFVEEEEGLSQVKEIIYKTSYYEFISRLSNHSEFRDSIEFSQQNLQNIYNQYSVNPYLRKIFSEFVGDSNTPSFNPVPINLAKIERHKRSLVSNSYSWHENMYGDKEMNLNEGITYQEVVSKYLTPVAIDAVEDFDNIVSRTPPSNVREQLDFNTLISGVSDFIVRRAQEEFNITFLEGFLKRLEKDSSELKLFFGNTLRSLQQFDLTNYKTMLESSRPAFYKDLDNLPVNLAKLLRTEKYQEKLKYSQVIFNIALIYQVSDYIQSGVSIEEVLLSTYQELKTRDKKLREEINLRLASQQDTVLLTVFRRKLIAYCEELRKVQTAIDALRGKLNNKENSKSIKRRLLEFDQKQKWSDQFVNRKHGVSDNYPDYFQNLITANLNGREYLGYLREFKLSAFDDLLSMQVPDPLVLKAAGFDLARQLLESNYPSLIRGQLNGLEDINLEIFKEKEQTKTAHSSSHYSVSSLLDEVSVHKEELEKKFAFYQEKYSLAPEKDRDMAVLKMLQHHVNELYYYLESIEEGSIDGPGKLPRSKYLDVEKEVRSIDEFIKRTILNLEDKILIKQNLENQKGQFANKSDSTETESKMPNHHIASVKLYVNDFAEAVDSMRFLPLEELEQIQKTLRAELRSQFEERFCPDLMAAKQGTQSLLKAIEYALHLIHAFDLTVSKTKYHQDTITLTDSITVTYEETIKGKKRISIVKEEIDKDIIVLSKSPLNQWLNKEQYQLLMADQNKRRIFLGLLLERMNQLSDHPNITPLGLELLVESLAAIIFDIQSLRKTLLVKKYNNQKLTEKDFYSLLRITINLINTVIASPLISNSSIAEKERIINMMPRLSIQALELYENLYARNYDLAIGNTAQLLSEILEVSDSGLVKGKSLKKGLVRYGTFIANVVNATSPGQVDAALRAVALSKGSSRIKREKKENLALNAYVSPFTGIEVNNRKRFGTFGLSVPIGIAYSFKTNSESRKSWSFFIPVLDIGAVTAFRIGNRDVSAFPEPLRLENYFAPGLFLHRNNRSSTSWSIGIQHGPSARKINLDGVEKLGGGFRITLNFSFDAPFLNLYSKDFDE